MIKNYLIRQVKKGSFPSFSYLIGKEDNILEYGYGGFKTLLPKKELVDKNTIYDLASITKPICTATVILKLHQEKILNIEDYIDKYIPKLKTISNQRIKIKYLMSHCAGLKDWYPLYISGKSIEEYIDLLSTIKLDYPIKKETKYSCLGYIILGSVIKKIINKSVKELFKEIMIDKFKLRNTFMHRNEEKIKNVAATENGSKYEMKLIKRLNLKYDGWRRYLIRGEVHDSNSYFANSETGNSGLFSDVIDLFKIGQIYYKDNEYFKEDIKEYFYRNYTKFSNEHWSLGWKLGSTQDSVGEILSDKAIGHSGFTGTSIWIEPFEKKIYILLTNRIHPKVKNINMNKIRKRFHKLAKRIYG